MDSKVSEKAVWEGSITPDNDTPSFGSQIQAQPQMMFCYKCNNVIPNNSTFCPYCQIKLFTECPKCGVKYSSQYPACNQCGTNREEYLLAQRREQERKEAIERENRRRQEIEERKRREAEAEKERRKKEEEERVKPLKDAYNAYNEKIMASDEYKAIYLLLSEANEIYDKKSKNEEYGVGLFMFSLLLGVILPPIGAITFIVSICMLFTGTFEPKDKFLKKHISKKNSSYKDMTDCAIQLLLKGIYDLSDCCIIAYREKHGLPVSHNWHNKLLK